MAAPCHQIFSWGANSYGQLGLGHTEDLLSPTPVVGLADHLDTLPGEGGQFSSQSMITGGGGHTFLYNRASALYGVGWNAKGQLGVQQVPHCLQPMKVEGLGSEVVTKVTAGWNFTYVITASGKLYSWGDNSWGQLGLPEVKGHTHSPAQITTVPSKVTDAACGLRHGVLLTDEGDVLCTGSGKKGQLGVVEQHGSPPKQRTQFSKVPLPQDCGHVVKVFAGAYHSAALTDRGKVLVWGDNRHGQLGIDPGQRSQINSAKISNLTQFISDKVSCLYSGWTHMLALTDSGGVYSWGRGDYGQLGRADGCPDRSQGEPTAKSSRMTSLHVPGKVNVPNVRQVAVGSEHNLIVTECGELYSWGWNEHGMCGTGDETNVTQPRLLQDLQGQCVIHVACGAGHSLAMTDGGHREKTS